MTSSIIISPKEIITAQNIESGVNVPFGVLDPRHPSISEEARKNILHDRYKTQLLIDGLETGQLYYEGTILKFRSLTNFPTIAGFIFEAYIVSRLNQEITTSGKEAFSWCTNRAQCKDDYIKQFKAIGTGFVTTRSAYPHYYTPQNKHDIIFIRKNPKLSIIEPATILGTNVTAGIQVKAITGNEYEEIIKPLLSGEYKNVLTLLTHNDKIHSYDHCIKALNQLCTSNKITLHERFEIESRIYNPSKLGIDHYEINEYYEYIKNWYQGKAPADEFTNAGCGLEIKGLKYSNGLLIPDIE